MNDEESNAFTIYVNPDHNNSGPYIISTVKDSAGQIYKKQIYGIDDPVETIVNATSDAIAKIIAPEQIERV